MVTADGEGSELEACVVKAFRDVLGDAELGPESDFFDAGGTSMKAAELLARLELLAGDRLPLGLISEKATARTLAAALGDVRVPGRVAMLNSSTASAQLFLVHGMGGHVLVFTPLARRLAGVARVYGIESVGRSDRGNRDVSVDQMAHRYVGEIRQLQARGPYRLGGYSMGGVVALEVAGRLVAAGEQVALVALLDCDLTQIAREPMGDRAIEFVSRALGVDPPVCLPYEQLEEGVAAMSSAIAARDGATCISTGQLRDYVQVYLDNEQALQGHRLTPYNGVVHLYYSQEGPHAGIPPSKALELLGWSSYLDAEVTVVFAVPGDHWTILSSQVEHLEQGLGPCLSGRSA